jgi:hypothetical protein
MEDKTDYNKMLERLDSMYEREEEIKRELIILKKEFEQLQEDKEMLQTMIMYKANKEERLKKKIWFGTQKL